MGSEKEYVCQCDVCRKDLFDGDKAGGLSEGDIGEELEGFEPNTVDPWLVLCEACREDVSDAINELQKKHMGKGT